MRAWVEGVRQMNDERNALVLALLLSACGVVTIHPMPPPSSGDCDGACANLDRLLCPAAQGSPGHDDRYGTSDDVACAQACADVEAAGIVTLDTECVSRARTCEEAEACER